MVKTTVMYTHDTANRDMSHRVITTFDLWRATTPSSHLSYQLFQSLSLKVLVKHAREQWLKVRMIGVFSYMWLWLYRKGGFVYKIIRHVPTAFMELWTLNTNEYTVVKLQICNILVNLFNKLSKCFACNKHMLWGELFTGKFIHSDANFQHFGRLELTLRQAYKIYNTVKQLRYFNLSKTIHNNYGL